MRRQKTTCRNCVIAWLCCATLGALGCGKEDPGAPLPSGPRMSAVHPARRTIRRSVGQPAFINAYEETSIYPKIAGYIEKWSVDIGDPIKPNQALATLFVPELSAEYEQKKAQVAEDDVAIDVARELVKVAEQDLLVATAGVKQAEANLGSYQSEVDRWTSEVNRLTGLAAKNVVDKQILDESQKQLKSNIAKRDAAHASIAAAQATEAARRVAVEKARVDVRVAEAKAQVSRADEKRFAALVSYTSLTAPYEGVVVVRNANTGDFVQPAGGDKSVEQSAVGRSESRGDPVYIVARTDLVRIFIDVPEVDANHVVKGTPAVIQVQSLGGAELKGAVTRTSWALNVRSRTLRAEVDLPNPDKRLLPGMYAFARVLIDRPDVMTVPSSSIVEQGNQTFCYLLKDGKAVKTLVQAAVSDGEWTEVSNKQQGENWVPFDGHEEVLVGDLSEVIDGQPIKIASAR